MARTYDDKMFIETFEHEYTWLSGFMRNVSRYPKRLAVLDPLTERKWTYRELNEEANRLANALKADGIGKNDVVMSAMLNCPEFVFSYISTEKSEQSSTPPTSTLLREKWQSSSTTTNRRLSSIPPNTEI